MSWENDFVGAIDKRKEMGGVQNIQQPATLVSVTPPAVKLCGVTITKGVHINPAMVKDDKKAAELEAAFDEFLEELDKAEEVEQLRGPTRKLLQFLLEREKQEPVKAGDRVMVRQQGTEFYVSNATGV